MKPFSTPLSRRIGLTYPLVSAPMFIISNREMLLACAEAGILGAMPSLNRRTHEAFVEDLAWLGARTDRPYAINLTIGLTDPERLAADVEACFEHRVPVLITSYGDPTRIVQAAKSRGTLVMHDVISLKHGLKAQAAGVDAIIAVSQGAGGHAGTLNPYVLVPYLREQLDVPIVAAGCISGGAQVAAAMALGAELAYMGTRFIASTECGAEARYKQMVVDATHDDVVYTDKVSGIHASFLKATIPDGTAPSRSPEAAKRWKDIWSAGQGVSLIHEVKPIGSIVEDVVREFHDAVARLH
ncbi:MAG: nitronate monooxygenase [Myxococcales bacterium]|nr:nitronate monooxygenase [Myxococcales bacterium]MCB9693929.1 nitronate monooxygenase [Alphaproteobacteria bacterium]